MFKGVLALFFRVLKIVFFFIAQTYYKTTLTKVLHNKHPACVYIDKLLV